MKTLAKLLACIALFAAYAAAPQAKAEAEKRIAFVVGNAGYQAGPLATSANDAGLIAQTLQAAGFDVSGARDLDAEALRAAFHDFLDKAQASGPDTVAFVYLAGYGVQLDGENYFVPVDAKIAGASDVAVDALRISDYTKRLSGLSLKAAFIVLDVARTSPFAASGPPLAGGLALAAADPNMLIAFNAAPGTVAPQESGPYGAYAQALAEMIREGGLAPAQVFDAVRLRVNEETKGAEVPWSASRIAAPFQFFERAADAPPPSLKITAMDGIRDRPFHELSPQDAYAAAIERDSWQGYEEFIAAYPSDPLARRVRALLAARREAMVWRRTCDVNTPDAYWSYLNRYPRGPHAADARWRLEALAVPIEPPPVYTPIVYEVPPPPPAEIVYVERPVLVLSDPAFGFVLPPPIVFLAPRPAYLVFPPPPPPVALFVLPVPAFVPIPAFVNPPAYVAPPPANVVFNNIHNTTIINTTNVVNPAAPVGAVGPHGTVTAAGIAAGAAAGAIAAKVALPPSLVKRSGLTGQPPNGPAPAALSAPTHALPGANGTPLPPHPAGQQGTPPGAPPAHALAPPTGQQGTPPGAPAHALAPPAGQQGTPPAAATHALPGAGPSKPLPPGGQKLPPPEQKRQPPQTYVPPRPPPQGQQPRQAQQAQPAPPAKQAQQPHPAPQSQKKERSCGQPPLPPCR